ncbi:MAG: methyltransferase domain-containing protein [Caldilineaceae bacterium]|nr:methyltransferase domain-containing protein [Caldilineaceae bacterium]
MNAADFAGKLDAWRRNQEQPWNLLRYRLVEATLLGAIGERGPRQVLDVGGGDGRDALPLARLGHTVTVMDYVPEMLAEAERRAAEAGVADRIATRLVDLAAGTLPVAAGAFDVVLCHNVIQYLADPQPVLAACAAALRPAGCFSLLVPNPASEALRLALQQHDLPGALAALDSTTHRNILFGAEVRLRDLPVLFAMLEAAGLAVVDYYGVRCVNDYMDNDERKFSAEGFEQLLALEQAMGRRSPYRDIARLWQIVARRPA